MKGKVRNLTVFNDFLSSRPFFLWLSITLWVSALAFPALISPDSKNTLGGINILLMGWLGVAGVEDGTNLLGVLAWWANLFYFWAIARAAFEKTNPTIVTYLAVATASLTALLSSYALNAVPSFTPIIGYGPGVLLWFLAIFTLAYVVTRDAGHLATSRIVVGIASGLLVAYLVQVGWRAVASNDSERERLPAHAAKRGYICSVTAPLLPIADRQEAIELKADSEYWLKSLIHWGVTAVQVDAIEYKRAPEGSPESKLPPYLLATPVSVPARYTLRAEGGYPFINKWSDGGDFVRLTVIDSQGKKDIGQLVYRREISRRLGFCPALTYYPNSQKEEAIKWLEPFIHTKIRK